MSLKLFMTLIGCKFPGRNIEQHDMFFGIGYEIKDLVPLLKSFWPDARKLHLDAWREVTKVDGYSIRVVEKTAGYKPQAAGLPAQALAKAGLYFINLGGYKKEEFEEFHYKMLVVAPDKGSAIQQAKQTAFYKHVGFEGATSHVDDKYGVDVDDIMEIKDILPKEVSERYGILIEAAGEEKREDEIYLGYFLVEKL